MIRTTTRIARYMSLVVWLLTACAGVHAQTSQLEQKALDLPGGKVIYQDSGGQGVAVVFLFAGTTALWQHQATAIPQAGYRFIAIDYRGLGAMPGSDMLKAVTGIDELLNRLGVNKFHLVGAAVGGVMAWQYALLHPDKLRSLSVSNSLGNLRDPDTNALESSLRPPPFGELPREVRDLSASYRASNPEGVKRFLELAPPPAPRPAQSTGAASGAPPSTAAGPAGAPNPNALTWDKVAQFPLPTLMMTGDGDLYTPPSIMRMFVARLKNGKAVVIEDSGHASYWENPEAFNRALLSFIAER